MINHKRKNLNGLECLSINMKTKPSKFPLVKFDFDNCPKEQHKYYKSLKGRTFILFGDIKQQPQHCILLDIKTKQFELFWHTDQFIELTEDEV